MKPPLHLIRKTDSAAVQSAATLMFKSLWSLLVVDVDSH